MSDSNPAEKALDRVRTAFEDAASEAEQMSETAQQEVREAIDNLEQEVESLRNDN